MRVQLVRAAVPPSLLTPPPAPPIVPNGPKKPVAELPEKVQLLAEKVPPAFSTPPPAFWAVSAERVQALRVRAPRL